MRLVCLVEHFPPSLGSDKRIFELSKQLVRRHDVHIVAVPSSLSLITRQLSRSGPARLDSVKVQRIYVPPLTHAAWSRSWKIAYPVTLVGLVLQTFRSIRDIRPDVVILNHPSAYSGLIGLLAAKLARVRVVLDFDDLIAEYTTCVLELKPSGILSSILTFIQWFIARHCDGVVVINDCIRREASRMGVRNTCVISNGAEAIGEQRAPSPAPDRELANSPLVCGMFGRLDDWTGVKKFEAIRGCLPSDGFRFVVAGQPAPSNCSFEYLGSISHEEMQSIYSLVDIVIIPFKKERFTHAASPLRLFEAAAMGKCIVSTRLQGIEEVFRDGEAILVDSDDPLDWAEHLRTLRKDRAMVARLGERARERVLKEYTWDSLSKKFEEFLVSIMSK